MDPSKLSRRDFVRVTTAGAAALAIGRGAPDAAPDGMPVRPFGRTGHKVRLFSLGGQATLEQPGKDDVAAAIVNRAIDLGVNYIDTAAAYGRGISQTYIGRVMATRRKEVFLATKTHDRTRDGSLELLEESLKLLQTDHVDLWQLHNVRLDEQVDQIFAKDGALEALTRARDEKMVRYLGITGHFDPAVLARAIERFPFDTVLMAINPADRHRLSFIDGLLPLANRKQMGVVAMKIPARGRLFRQGGITSIRDAMYYVLSQPVSTVIIGCDSVAQLEENVALATSFQPLPKPEQTRLEQLTAGYETEAAWFKKDAAGWARPGNDDQNTD
jgi:aryl-alcohol dehydrogenase-like predicted oxidoreductase